jgi:hypothetical protein
LKFFHQLPKQTAPKLANSVPMSFDNWLESVEIKPKVYAEF